MANAHGETGAVSLGDIARRASLPPGRCRELVRIARGAPDGDALELGANVGVSGAYLAAHMAQAGTGRLVTVEGVPDLADAARRTASIVGVEGTMEVVCATFDDALERLEGQWAFIFLDGEHVADPTRRYAEAAQKILMPGGIMVIDDCSEANGLDQIFDEVRDWPCWAKGWGDGRFGVLRKWDARSRVTAELQRVSSP